MIFAWIVVFLLMAAFGFHQIDRATRCDLVERKNICKLKKLARFIARIMWLFFIALVIILSALNFDHATPTALVAPILVTVITATVFLHACTGIIKTFLEGWEEGSNVATGALKGIWSVLWMGVKLAFTALLLLGLWFGLYTLYAFITV